MPTETSCSLIFDDLAEMTTRENISAIDLMDLQPSVSLRPGDEDDVLEQRLLAPVLQQRVQRRDVEVADVRAEDQRRMPLGGQRVEAPEVLDALDARAREQQVLDDRREPLAVLRLRDLKDGLRRGHREQVGVGVAAGSPPAARRRPPSCSRPSPEGRSARLRVSRGQFSIPSGARERAIGGRTDCAASACARSARMRRIGSSQHTTQEENHHAGIRKDRGRALAARGGPGGGRRAGAEDRGTEDRLRARAEHRPEPRDRSR